MDYKFASFCLKQYIEQKIQMKKSLLFLSVAIASSAFASTELENLAKGVDSSSPEFAQFLANFVEGGESVKDSVETSEGVTTEPVKEAIEEQATLLTKKVEPPQPLVAVKPFSASDSEPKKYSSTSSDFLISNIPQTSRIVFNSQINILPYNSQVHFKNGERLYHSPIKNEDGSYKNELTTFCTLNLSEYGIGRRIDKSKEFEIKKIDYSKETISFKGYGDVKMQRVVMHLDNPHLKDITCLSTQQMGDFTIGDVKYQTGGILDFRLRDYISI